MTDQTKLRGATQLPPPPPSVKRQVGSPAAQGLGTPQDFRRSNPVQGEQTPMETSVAESPQPQDVQGPRRQSTETIAQRAGALSDEIDFPDFVAGLVHGTFDAIVDSAIRQMESYADLVSAVAKTEEQFATDNVSLNQARDWLVQQYPEDLYLDLSGPPKVLPRPLKEAADDTVRAPAWLKEFQLEGEELTPELIEETLVPKARLRVGSSRQQTLATLVLLGLNRVVVRDGSVSARLRFRAAAADKAKVEYAVSDDPSGGSNWGGRGSSVYQAATTKVSTVGVNVQSDAELKAELFGEVKINFASETLPLDRFVDDARRTMLERRAKPGMPPNQSPLGTAAPSTQGPPVQAPPIPAPTGRT